MKRQLGFPVIALSLIILLGCKDGNAGNILDKGGSMAKGKDQLASGRVIPGTAVNLRNLSEEERGLVAIAIEKAKGKGVNARNPSISMGKIGDEVFIDVIDPAKLPPPGSLGGGVVRVTFKKSGEVYVLERIGILE